MKIAYAAPIATEILAIHMTAKNIFGRIILPEAYKENAQKKHQNIHLYRCIDDFKRKCEFS